MAAAQEAQNALNPDAPSPTVDPQIILGRRASRHRSSGSTGSTMSERTVQKSMQRLQDWRKTIKISERKRLRRTAIDMWVVS
jgi:hypothetical protein